MNYSGAEPTGYDFKIYLFLIKYALIEECAPSPEGITLEEGRLYLISDPEGGEIKPPLNNQYLNTFPPAITS